MSDFSYGKGRISLAKIDPTTGLPGKYRYVGDVSALSLKLAVDKVEHVESNTGQNGLVKSFPIKNTATIDMTMHELDAENLSLTLYGTSNTTASGTVTAEVLESDLAAGDVVYLKNPGVSDVVITDSTGTPATLVEGTDYTVEEANFGRLRIINVGTYTQPFKAAYSYRGRKAVGMFTAGQSNYALRYEGYNLAENNRAEIVDLYKIAPDPLQELALIATGNDVAGMQVSGGVLQDTSKPLAGALGQYGAIAHVDFAA